MTTRTWERARRIGALMIAMATTLAWGERASASCPGPIEETWQLEVHSVTVDGVPVRATPWVLLPVSIRALPDGRVVMVAQGPHGSEEAYYVAAR